MICALQGYYHLHKRIARPMILSADHVGRQGDPGGATGGVPQTRLGSSWRAAMLPSRLGRVRQRAWPGGSTRRRASACSWRTLGTTPTTCIEAPTGRSRGRREVAELRAVNEFVQPSGWRPRLHRSGPATCSRGPADGSGQSRSRRHVARAGSTLGSRSERPSGGETEVARASRSGAFRVDKAHYSRCVHVCEARDGAAPSGASAEHRRKE